MSFTPDGGRSRLPRLRGNAYAALKRVIDVLVATIVLLSVAPLLLLCAIVIVLDSPGPVLFRQQRVGKGGRMFTLLKLRSMCTDADPELHRGYVSEFIRGRAERSLDSGREIYKVVHDPRITRAGRWLRKTSMDELPQLWNVLRGEMSLVGPRPPIPYEVEFYSPDHRARLNAKPGITGLWQVSGRNSTTFEDMVQIDVDYIQRASLRLDLEIMARTIPVVLKGQGT